MIRGLCHFLPDHALVIKSQKPWLRAFIMPLMSASWGGDSVVACPTLMFLCLFVRQRLEQEYGASVITTAPTVPFEVYFPDGTQKEILNPSEFPVGAHSTHADVLLMPRCCISLPCHGYLNLCVCVCVCVCVLCGLPLCVPLYCRTCVVMSTDNYMRVVLVGSACTSYP